MYLSDRDIKTLLPQIRFETDNPEQPFNEDDQIQPCSVDLRLDRTFWLQARKRPIDPRRDKLLQLSPRHNWTEIVLAPGESVKLKPGEMVLGRTYETFTVPDGCAGKIEGRSSFARLGLGIHCTGDFINPGWRGRMPLQLTNFGRSSLRLFPYLPICQIVFVRLSSVPERTYGASELASKYMNDDGGPSYWWRDKRIRALQRSMGEHDLTERIQEEILALMGPQDPDLVERFERFVGSLRIDEVTNAGEILRRFAGSEDHKSVIAQVLRGVRIGASPVLIACSIGSLFSQPFGWKEYGWLHYALWAITAISIPVSIGGIRLRVPEFFGTQRLDAIRRTPKSNGGGKGQT